MSPICKFSYPVASKIQTDKPQLEYDILISLWNCHLLASLSHLKQKAVWSIFWLSSLSVLPWKVLIFSKELNLVSYQYSLEKIILKDTLHLIPLDIDIILKDWSFY